MKLRYIAAVILLASTFGTIIASNVDQLPTRKVGELNYYVYEATKRESVYGVSKKLDISVDELLKYNPSAEDGLKKGQKLFFPAPTSEVKTAVEVVENVANVADVPTTVHVVERGETLYGLSKKYNTTQEQILACNPQAKDGLSIGEQLTIPAVGVATPAEDVVASVEGEPVVIYHTLKEGETLYRLTLKYSTTVAEILTLNPTLSPVSYEVGDVVKVQPNTIAKENTSSSSVTGFIAHKADRGDSLESIAEEYGVDEELVKETNHDIDRVKRGNYVYIPTEVSEDTTIDTLAMEAESVAEIDSIYTAMNPNVDEVVNVAMILPFDLENKYVSNEAEYFTQFYKGFLLAVDSLSSQMERELNIYAYDSKAKDKSVAGILNEKIMKDMDLIFTPNNAADINMICEFADTNNINVANIFSTKCEEYIEQENTFHVNIPQSFMISETMDYVAENFNDYTFVFVNDANDAEKKAIVDDLMRYADSSSVTAPVVLEIDKDDNSIAGLDSVFAVNDRVMLIPTSASKLTLMKVILALGNSKGRGYGSDFVLFGHPEWVTYTDMYNYLCKYNSYIYSRFFLDTKSAGYADFIAKFYMTYGEGIKASTPNFALLGFDAGIYYLAAMDKQGGDFNNYNVKYSGIQTDYMFERVNNWSGFVNKAMQIVHFAPDNDIKRITIY